LLLQVVVVSAAVTMSPCRSRVVIALSRSLISSQGSLQGLTSQRFGLACQVALFTILA